MKKEQRRVKSVRTKLFFTLIISIIVIIVILIFTNSIVLKSFYTYSKVNSVKQAYLEINELYKRYKDPADEIIDRIAFKNNFEILIQTKDNVVLYSTNNNFINVINKNKDNIMHSIDRNIGRKRLIYFEDNMTVSLIHANDLESILLTGVLDSGQLIYIQMSIAAIDESVRISNQLLIIMGAVIAMFSAIVASVISKNFATPILKLKGIANKMAKLDFSEKYKVTDSDDEIDELGRSINTMSKTLESTINQLRRNNNQLEKDIEEKSKIDEMRKQFISDVSHELKTPIALIQGYAEGLVENVNSDEESKKYYAEVILDESNKMDRLVKQLMDLMKIEYGKREFNNQKFNICELIEEVLRKCNVMIKEKEVTVEFDNKQTVEVYADEFYIEQAFTNYITNAIKHVKEKYGEKKIIIKIDNKNDEVYRISVFNTGDNISEDNLNRIWGRFYKVDESRNREDGGTGIGLSLVKAIMTSYNSEYGVVNKENGVEFYFDIKAYKGIEEKGEQNGKKRRDKKNSNGK